MKHQLKKWISLFILSCLTTFLVAQKYSYIQYDATQGAPFNEVSSTLHDEQGFLWIGSPNGLYRFDGITFENIGIHIQSQNIHRLVQSDGKIIFINDTGIHQISNLSSTPTVSTIIEGSIIESDTLPFYPNSLLCTKSKEIWISQSNHSVGNLQQDTFITYPFSSTDKPYKIELREDANGNIWALSPLDGLFLFDRSKNNFVKKLNIKNGQALFINESQFLIGGDNLYQYSLRKNNKLRLQRTIFLEDDSFTSIYLGENNQYIIGTQNGKLYYLQDLKSQLKTVYGANEAHRVEELDFGRINEIYASTDSLSNNKNLWISSKSGLWLLKQTMFEIVFNLPKNNPIGVALNSKGNAYVPLNGLYEISLGKEEFVARQINKDNQITAVATDLSDDLWVCTASPKVELLKYHNNTITNRYSFSDRGEDIFYLLSDSKKNLWFCQSPSDKPIIGVGKINANGTVQLYDETKGFASRVLVIKESNRGEIYAAGIGENSYLYHYNSQEERFENLSLPLPFESFENFEVHDLTIDDRGVVWLASTEGLLRYDSEKITLIQNEILKQEEVRGVTHIGDENIWVATATNGIVFLQKNNSTQISETAGLPASINAYRCIKADKNGRIWAGTTEGLVYSRITGETLPYSNTPRIKQVLIDQKKPKKESDEKITFHENSQLELSITNLFFPSRNIQYQYRLIPKEEKDILLEEYYWQSNNYNNIITLKNIEVGNYILEIRARQPDGFFWSLPLAIQLKVIKPWFLKRWFLYPVIASLLLLVGYYFRVQMRRRINHLQEILNFAQKKLAESESLLNQKIIEFDVQQEELANATSNIHTLELFVKFIPKKASWNDIINAMAKAVDEPNDIHAFEICFIKNHEIYHKGYSNKEKGGFTFRGKPFNPKTSLTSWAIANHKEVLINDFDKEHVMFIQRKKAYRFKSLAFVPFYLKNNQSAALCVYNTKKNAFDKNDITMLRILTRFIISSAQQEISKTV